jgi:prephenate dehydrogenase
MSTDERYFAKGHREIWKHFIYSTTRIIITQNPEGRNRLQCVRAAVARDRAGHFVEVLPQQNPDLRTIRSKYEYVLLRDAAANAFREFWPESAVHVLLCHPLYASHAEMARFHHKPSCFGQRPPGSAAAEPDSPS